jgi:hypothetical protein
MAYPTSCAIKFPKLYSDRLGHPVHVSITVIEIEQSHFGLQWHLEILFHNCSLRATKAVGDELSMVLISTAFSEIYLHSGVNTNV